MTVFTRTGLELLYMYIYLLELMSDGPEGGTNLSVESEHIAMASQPAQSG